MRTIIWITDEPFQNPTYNTNIDIQDVIDAMLNNGIKTHCVGNPTYQVAYYDQIVISTGGSFYDIYGNFRDVLMDVARINGNSNYLLTYEPEIPITNQTQYIIEAHYAGLGGSDTINFNPAKILLSNNKGFKIIAFPNPISNKTSIQIKSEKDFEYLIEIYDIKGQTLASKRIFSNNNFVNYDLNNLINTEQTNQPEILFLKVSIVEGNNKNTISNIKLLKK